jgi:hypothetical protein
MSDKNKNDVTETPSPEGEGFAGQFCSASPWQPIETAPQTNKAILVWIEDVKCPALVYWDKYLKPCPGWVHFHSYGQLLTRTPNLWMPCPEPDEAIVL